MGQRPGAGGPSTLPGGNPAKRFTRPRIRERNVRVVQDTFGVRASPQKVRKKFTNRYQIDLLDTGSDTGSLAGTHWVHIPAVNDR
jgi:hypothetical protein